MLKKIKKLFKKKIFSEKKKVTLPDGRKANLTTVVKIELERHKL